MDSIVAAAAFDPTLQEKQQKGRVFFYRLLSLLRKMIMVVKLHTRSTVLIKVAKFQKDPSSSKCAKSWEI